MVGGGGGVSRIFPDPPPGGGLETIRYRGFVPNPPPGGVSTSDDSDILAQTPEEVVLSGLTGGGRADQPAHETLDNREAVNSRQHSVLVR